MDVERGISVISTVALNISPPSLPVTKFHHAFLIIILAFQAFYLNKPRSMGVLYDPPPHRSLRTGCTNSSSAEI